MKRFNGQISAVVLCLFEFLIGILLLIDPVGFTRGIIIALGVALLAAGIVNIIAYARTNPVQAAIERKLANGLCFAALGIFCVARPGWLVAAFPLLTILYGLIMLVAGISKLQWMVDALRLKRGKWYIRAIGAALSLIISVIILLNPFTTTVFMWNFVGISLIVEAVADFVALIFMGNADKTV